MSRNPLKKEAFMEGTRQKWLAVLIAVMMVILLTDALTDIDSDTYLLTLGTMGTTFILGAANDSRLKIQAAEKKLELEHEETTTE